MPLRRKSGRPVLKPRGTLFCHYQYDRPASGRVKKVVQRSRIKKSRLTASSNWLCKVYWLAFTLLLEEMKRQQEEYKRQKEGLNEAEGVHEKQKGYEVGKANEMQDNDSEEIPNTYEPIKLEQRAVLRRRHQPTHKLVALHELYQDAEDLANEELEMATAIIVPESLENIRFRLGISDFYQE